MNRGFRLTRRAEESLFEIARWTMRSFGPQQAERYEAEIIARCEAIAAGRATSRDCSTLIAEAKDLRFTRAGEHFIVFLDQPDQMIVVDILHSHSDLPRHIAALTMPGAPDPESR